MRRRRCKPWASLNIPGGVYKFLIIPASKRLRASATPSSRRVSTTSLPHLLMRFSAIPLCRNGHNQATAHFVETAWQDSLLYTKAIRRLCIGSMQIPSEKAHDKIWLLHPPCVFPRPHKPCSRRRLIHAPCPKASLCAAPPRPKTSQDRRPLRDIWDGRRLLVSPRISPSP